MSDNRTRDDAKTSLNSFLLGLKDSIAKNKKLAVIFFFYWGWINVLFYSGLFGFKGSGELDSFSADSLWNISIVFNVATLFFLFLASRTTRFGRKARAIVAAPVSSSLGIALVVASNIASKEIGAFLFLLGSAFVGAGIAFFMYRLECLLMHAYVQDALLFLSCATAGSAFFCLLLSAMDSWLVYLVMIIVPLLIGHLNSATVNLLSTNSVNRSEVDFDRPSKVRFGIISLVILAAVVGLSLGLVRSKVSAPVATISNSYYYFMAALFSAGVLLVVTTRVFTRKGSFTFLYIGLIIVAAGLLMLTFSFNNVALAEFVHSVGFYYFNSLFWVFCARLSIQSRYPDSTLIICFFVYQFFQTFGGFLGAFILSRTGAMSSVFSDVLTAVIYLFLIASVFAFIYGVRKNATVLDFSLSEQLEKCCNEITSIYHLTKREQDVLLLLIKGYDRGRISESLNISKETEKTHVSHIYVKLGIHSRQELLMLMWDTMDS